MTAWDLFAGIFDKAKTCRNVNSAKLGFGIEVCSFEIDFYASQESELWKILREVYPKTESSLRGYRCETHPAGHGFTRVNMGFEFYPKGDVGE